MTRTDEWVSQNTTAASLVIFIFRYNLESNILFGNNHTAITLVLACHIHFRNYRRSPSAFRYNCPSRRLPLFYRNKYRSGGP
jgi:hypothetical protein